MKLINRSFGFTFRGKFLQGSAYQNGSTLDMWFDFDGVEYTNSNEFITKNNLTEEERRGIQDKVNQLIK